MVAEFLTGARYLSRGFRLLWTPGIRRYALLPVLINILAFSVLISIGANAFDAMLNGLMPDTDGWWTALARWLLWLVFGTSVVLVMFFTFTLVTNLLGAPFNGLLSAAVEGRLGNTDSEPPPDWTRLLRELWPALLNEIRKFVYYLAWALPLLTLFVLPVVQLIAPAAWLLFSAWMMALQYLDYPASNHELRFRQLRSGLAKRRWLGLGFGAAVTAATLLPGLNLFVMPAAVAGATALWSERLAASVSRDENR